MKKGEVITNYSDKAGFEHHQRHNFCDIQIYFKLAQNAYKSCIFLSGESAYSCYLAASLDILFECSVNEMAESQCSMDTLTQQGVDVTLH